MNFLKRILPTSILNFLRPIYHWMLAVLSAIFYGWPSKKMIIVGVTGTNGKTSVVEFLSRILKEAGIKTASVSSLYFRIEDEVKKNDLKMTMPGRFFLQKFLSRALRSDATHAVLEITSEGIKQFRHTGIDWDILIFTNLTPEHIESHGSFENYKKTKEKVFEMLSKTFRKTGVPKTIIANDDDPHAKDFLKYDADQKITYSKNDASKNEKLTGEFNLYNLAAAIKAAEALGIPPKIVRSSAEKIEGISGRMEFIQREPFAVIVDYAHTPDALRKVYQTLKPQVVSSGLISQTSNSKLICVLGAAGGGRDRWKRPEMGRIAERFCDKIILTNEDPYDEKPEKILHEISSGFSSNNQIPNSGFQILKILDRKEAIKKAISDAKAKDIVVITGKGAEPWIMGPNGTRTEWDDRESARDALTLK